MRATDVLGRHRRGRRALCAAFVAAIGLGVPAAFAQSWPTKPVTVVVGVPPGGALDPFARALADQLARVTGGTFVVDNKPGANGNLSAQAVLAAPPDGHTLWIGTQSMMAINPAAFDNLRWKPSDFTPILKGVEAPLVLVTNHQVPARNFEELVKWIQDPANKASYASFSPGTPSHFLGYQLNERLKASMVHVPYKGSAPQVTDLVSGQVPLGFTQLASAVPQIKDGKLRAIAVTGPKRYRFLPDVPTLAELGYGDLGTTIWFGLFAPAGTPPATLDAIRSAAQKAHQDPTYRKRLEALEFDVPDVTLAEFEKTIGAETARWAQLVKATNFKANQ